MVQLCSFSVSEEEHVTSHQDNVLVTEEHLPKGQWGILRSVQDSTKRDR